MFTQLFGADFQELADATQAAPVPSDPYTRQNVMWFCSNICGGKDLRIKCSQSLLGPTGVGNSLQTGANS